MSNGQDGVQGEVQLLAGVENQFAATLTATSDQIAHSECLDVEERSEVYTILKAIQADTKLHRETLEMLAHRFAGDAADA
jgi:hypothetical protein